MATVSVLCARVRIEDKLLLQALAEAGVPAAPVPPEANPLDLSPSPAGPFAADAADGLDAGLLLDRCQDRTIGAAVVAHQLAHGVTVHGAGLAATGTRLDVAVALNRAGVPRPAGMLAPSEQAGIAALDQLGYPATLLPLRYGKPGLPILDRDSAEAVLEHRDTLGGVSGAMTMLQAGCPSRATLSGVVVVGGQAVAIRQEAGLVDSAALEIAERAAEAIGATIAGIELFNNGSEWVVWDIVPVPELRAYEALPDQSIYGAIADLVTGKSAFGSANALHVAAGLKREVAGGVVLSA